MPTYSTGRPCKYGHDSERYTSNGICIACDKENKLALKPWRAYPRDQRESSRKHYRNNPEYYREKWDARKALLKQASVYTPDGEKQIKRIQIACRMLTLATNERHEVDHIVPLTHPDVCGLHAPANLQILSAKANRWKSNRFDREEVEKLENYVMSYDTVINALYVSIKALRRKKARRGERAK